MSKHSETETKQDVVLTGVEKEMQTDIAKCPGCGASMTFYPEKQLLKCEHCGSEKPFAMNENSEQDFEKLFEQSSTWSDETHVFACDNCGARQVLAKTEIATFCSFCGTPNIVEAKELSGLRPNAIVPFKIAKETAIQKAIAWVRKRFFAPKKFKRSIDPQDVNGVYNPAFTFDSKTLSFYKGRLGRTKTVTRRVNGKITTVTKTEYFNVSGTYSAFFDDILVQASSIIKQKDLNKIQPFSTNDSKEYANEFLHGYTATQYTKDGKQCWGEARKVIDKRIRAAILSKYNYSVVDYLNVSTEVSNTTYKYLLLPLYVGHFNWKKKVYNFFVNGHNGKVAGRIPISPLKVLLVVGIGLVIAGGIIALGLLM